MSRPVVSVVIPTHNRPELLAQALDSIVLQCVDGVEAVVVNDGGCDVSDAVAVHRDQLDIRLVTLSSNQGLPAARNAGIDVARGQWLAFLDDDDVWLPGHLAGVLEELGGTSFEMLHTDCLVAHARHDPRGTEPVRTHFAFDYPFPSEAFTVRQMLPGTGIVCRAFGPNGPRFDTSLGVCEDWDMWLQLTRRLKWRVRHLPQQTAVWHRMPSMPSMTTSCATTIAGMHKYADHYRMMHRRWPVPEGSLAAAMRSLPFTMFKLAAQRMAEGRPVSHHFTERCAGVVNDTACGTLTLAQATDAMAEIILPYPWELPRHPSLVEQLSPA
ncbi:glycosyltransferase family 2 protein [Streptomyces sp. NPDC059278]|uniref:glycosyltransferase family 2 protein n=1 Tax=Streptomyces sp. NPDC059278 TaxID=3346801 RepID=UPI00369C45C3